MKQLVSLLIILLAFTSHCFASQERGLYVNLNNDTIRGKIKVYECLINGSETTRFDNMYDRQFKMLFIDSLGKAHDLTPDTVRAVLIFEGESRGLYQSCKTFEAGPVFLKYEVYGKAKLFCGFYNDPLGKGNFGTENQSHFNGTCAFMSPRFYVQKDDGKLTSLSDVFFKKFFCGLFADVPALVEKIKSGEYKEKDLKTIVMEYNYWARNGHAPDLGAPSEKKY